MSIMYYVVLKLLLFCAEILVCVKLSLSISGNNLPPYLRLVSNTQQSNIFSFNITWPPVELADCCKYTVSIMSYQNTSTIMSNQSPLSVILEQSKIYTFTFSWRNCLGNITEVYMFGKVLKNIQEFH